MVEAFLWSKPAILQSQVDALNDAKLSWSAEKSVPRCTTEGFERSGAYRGVIFFYLPMNLRATCFEKVKANII